jgi:hypothetical protein
MTGIQQQELTEELLQKVRIFVDNDALAFFDINHHSLLKKLGIDKPTDVAEIENKPFEFIFYEDPYTQKVNFSVKENKIHYFRVGNYLNPFCTVSVTGPCILFCGYTTEKDGGVKSSGIYHALSMPPEEAFQKRYFKLIDTVRSNPNERVIVKAAGRNYSEEDCEKIREDLIELSTVKDVEIKPEHILLGGPVRINEFYPQKGQLVTCFYDGKEKTTL